MKHRLKAYAPLLILTAGIAIAAASGARLGELDFNETLAQGQHQLSGLNNQQIASPTKPVDPNLRLRNWFDVSGGLFGVGMLLIVAGSIMARRRQGALREQTNDVDAPGDLPKALAQLASDITALHEALDVDSPDTVAIRTQIEALQLGQLEPVLANRQSLEQRFGLAGFAALIGPLSSVERFLNRTWTVLVDHHLDEARRSITMASEAMEKTLSAYDQLVNESGTSQ